MNFSACRLRASAGEDVDWPSDVEYRSATVATPAAPSQAPAGELNQLYGWFVRFDEPDRNHECP